VEDRTWVPEPALTRARCQVGSRRDDVERLLVAVVVVVVVVVVVGG
jgi:hypothetical protein